MNRRYLKLLLFVGLVIALAVPMVVNAAQSAQPPITHPVDAAHQNCVGCHKTGVAGAPKMPTAPLDHSTFGNDTCQQCHQLAAAPAATPTATVAPTKAPEATATKAPEATATKAPEATATKAPAATATKAPEATPQAEMPKTGGDSSSFPTTLLIVTVVALAIVGFGVRRFASTRR